MQDIIIKVSEAGTAAARTFAYEIIADALVAAQGTLTPVQTQQVYEIGSQYFSLLEAKGQEQAMSYLPLLRDALAHIFLERGEQGWRESIASDARLVISSSIPEVLQLPWELLRFWPSIDGRLRAVRRPGIIGESSLPRPKASAGPLRLLFLASDSIAREEEEKAVLEMAEGLEMEVVVCESGTRQELKEAAGKFRPHLLHLAVTAKSVGGGAAVYLPDRSGGMEMISAEDLAQDLQDSVSAIVLSGGGMGSAQALHLFCQRLSDKIPLALAWDAPAALLRPFYQALAAGADPEDALHTWPEMTAGPSGTGSGLLPFPALYSQAAGFGPMIDSQARKSASEFPACLQIPALIGLAEGRTECFVGRRAETTRLYPALRDGGVHTLIITGQDGSGKSSLAVYLCRLLAEAGYAIIPIYSSPNNPITWTRLLEAVASYLKAEGQEGQAKELLGSKAPKDRMSVTSNSLPSEALTLPARAWQWKTEGLSQGAFVRRLLYMPAVADRYRKGEISFAALAENHRIASGLPLRLDQTARALSLDDMAAGEEPLAALTCRLERDSLNALCRASVYDIAVSPTGIAASLNALCRASVYDIAVSPTGIAAACGLTIEQAESSARSWQALSLAHSSGELWTVPSALRSALVSRLPGEEIQSAHREAAGFLKSLAEAGHSGELGLSRLDVLLEARGHYMAAEDWQAAAATTGRISSYLRRRGHYEEIIRLNRELLDQEPHSLAGPAAWMGQAYLDQEDFKKAGQWYERAVQISPEPANYHGLGLSLMHQERYDQAKESLQKASDAYNEAGDLSGQAAVLSSLAAIDMKKGDTREALEKMERIAGIMKQLGDLPGEAQALQETARLEMMASNFDSARQRLNRSLELLQSSGDSRSAAFALFNLASLDLERGDFQNAAEEYARALPLFRAMGDQAGVAAILHSQGLIQAQAGEKELAISSFKEALAINQELGDRAAEAGSFFQLGALAVQQDRMAEGLRLMALAAVVLRRAQLQPGAVHGHGPGGAAGLR
ncbi:MAG: tetratricopeptide repeat protein [Methanothrix sp.]|nr:tetratricopeptide repeat protein [Methanothrix sp.]